VSKQQWETSALSETGPMRDENQDRMSGFSSPVGEVYVVADGMGGHKGGARAAALSVESVERSLASADPSAPVPDLLARALQYANSVVHREASSGAAQTEGMGSTAVVLVTTEDSAYVAHVGDSRAYLFRGGKLQALTRDHSRVQRMLDDDLLTPEEARNHPDASVLDRAIGSKPDVKVEVREEPVSLEDGDGFLLCSDGLCGYVEDKAIQAVLRGRIDVQGIPRALADVAYEKGSDDNVTVQYVQYGARRRERSLLPATLAARPDRLALDLASTRPGWRSPARLATMLAAVLAALAIGWFLGQRGGDDPHETVAAQDPTNTLEARLTEKDDELKDLQAQVQAKDEEIARIEAALADKAGTTAQSAQAREALDAELNNVKAQLEAEQDRYGSLDKKLEEAQRRLKSAAKETAALKAELQSSSDSRDRESGKLAAQRDEFERKLGDVSRQLEQMGEKYDELKKATLEKFSLDGNITVSELPSAASE